MAATPSKPSPSNKAVVETAAASNDASPENNAAAKPPSSTVANENAAPLALKAPPPPPPPASEPTYFSSEQSQHYTVAKTLLNEGDFEQALQTIEEGIEATQKALTAFSTDADVTFHESMAPFHYLYGTTLLYSIEESTDLQQQMTNAVGGQAEEADDEADDSQIAWENLEIARAILEKMLQTPREEQPLVEQKLRVDLAQVLVREGDLQRQNGRYEQAVADYTSCLQLREGDSGLGPYDRKIADVHYQLGLTYTLMAAETKAAAPPEQQRGEQQRPVVPEEEDTDRKRAFYRSRSFHHFVECSKAFAGQIAVLCGVDPVGLLKRADSDIPKFKSTGEEEQEDDVDHPKIAGLKLASLRKHLGQLTPPIAEQSTYTDLCMLLEEIQETVDEAENAEKGVHQVAEMKEQITAAVAAQAGQAAEAPAGGETGAAAGGETTVGFGSAAAAANTAAAKPVMMVVKKKMKKRDTPEDEGEDGKPPAKDPPSKRAKTDYPTE